MKLEGLLQSDTCNSRLNQFSMQLIHIKCMICCRFGLDGETQNYIELLVLHPSLLFHFCSVFCLFLGCFIRGRH